MRTVLVLLMLASGAFTTASAQARPYTPTRGSAERHAIMDALRPPVSRAVGEPVVFTVVRIHVQNGWAFVQAVPTLPRGEPLMDRYIERMNCESCTENVVGLLRWNGSRWNVVEIEIASSEYPYSWQERHRAPRAIFPWNQPR
ncbi:MAG TPA: hypothetical protein VLK84_22765 [Longimicrobium sp.]|nr:hypothetical protein [Longimicrobium sp.]